MIRVAVGSHKEGVVIRGEDHLATLKSWGWRKELQIKVTKKIRWHPPERFWNHAKRRSFIEMLSKVSDF